MLLRSSHAGETLKGFDALSAAKKQEFVTIVSDPVRYARALRPGSSNQETLTRPINDNLSATLSQTATTYDVTSTYWKSATILGVAMTTAYIQYRYQTRAGLVVSSQSCSSWYTGNTTGLGISTQPSHWLSGGKGYCYTVNTIQVVWRLGYSFAQEGWLYVNGVGIFSAGFRNL